jgi:hypothetical protein
MPGVRGFSDEQVPRGADLAPGPDETQKRRRPIHACWAV